MNEPNSDELLSAYVDGELSAQERAAVERWLEQSPEARRTLDEFRGISGLLAGLSRAEVSQEFPQNVLQLAERRMLLAEPAVASTRRRHRGWMLAVGAPLAAAALLLVTVELMRRDGDLPRPGDQVATVSSSGVIEESQSSMPALQEATGEASGGSSVRAKRTGRAQVDGPASAPRGDGNPVAESVHTNGLIAPDGAIPQMPTGGTRVSGGAAKTVAGPATARFGSPQLSRSLQGSADTLAEGAVSDNPQVAALDRELEVGLASDAKEERVTVVTLFVDAADGMVLVQNLLTKSNVVADDKGLERGLGRSDDQKEKDPTSRAEGEREGLYVVAERTQLLATISRMLTQENAILRLEVEEPIALSALNTDSKARLKQLELGLAAPVAPLVNAAESKSPAADKAANSSRSRGGLEGAVGRAETPKSANKSDQSAPSRAFAEKKKMSAVKPAESGVAPQPAERKDALVRDSAATNKDNMRGAADRAKGEGQSSAEMAARQMIIQIPRRIAERRAGRAKQQGPTEPDAATNAPAGAAKSLVLDGKPEADDEQGKAPQSLVRVLIFIEREPAKPAAPAKKSSSDGAS